MEIRIGKDEMDSISASYIYAMSWKKAFKGIFSDELLESIHNDFWVDVFNSNYKTKRFDTAIISKNGIDIGAGSFGYSRDYSDKKYGEITSIHLLEEYWGKGYAKPLLYFMIDKLKEKGCLKIHLWVVKENTRARKFYEKCGFIQNGKQKILEFKGAGVNELEYIYK